MIEKKGPDPICRWNNPSLKHVRRLVDVLPKEIMDSSLARTITDRNYGGAFFDTPYQLACQLGLYYESNNYYYPKFTNTPSDNELFFYMENWITKYYVPNPYTKSFKKYDFFKNLHPFSIHSKLCEKLYNSKTPLNWPEAYLEIFPGHVKNTDIIKNALYYSKVLLINNKKIILRDSENYEDLLEYIIDVPKNSIDDKQFFFLNFDHNYFIQKDLAPILSELEKFDKKEIETVKEAIVKIRIGQSNFRRDLLNSNKNKCIFTGITNSKLLIAGHIKPWKDSDNNERLNISNGILLTPTFDKLFDEHLITFSKNGDLIWSIKRLDYLTIESIKESIKNLEPIKIDITIDNESYFEYHRRTFYQLDDNYGNN
jgi:hypothetical protein